MIKADFAINTDELIQSFTISGHAEFDEEGKDIVCSAVTALAFSTINSIEELLKVDAKLEIADEAGGYLSADYLDSCDDESVQLLLSHLLLGLENIEKSYSQYLKLKYTRIS